MRQICFNGRVFPNQDEVVIVILDSEKEEESGSANEARNGRGLWGI